ncbi:MAG: hypothetical protein RL591_612 [Planctomycetota bacterium]
MPVRPRRGNAAKQHETPFSHDRVWRAFAHLSLPAAVVGACEGAVDAAILSDSNHLGPIDQALSTVGGAMT